ncbi:Uncharacterised protein [uncultured archaeon]|nr:Uncharacterised protein [uncultured archaeon]
MCKLCETNPVYEFTNKRKLCKTCFIHYFEKKVLYTIRKFKMIQSGDFIGYKKTNDFRSVVLENILNFLSEKSNFQIVKLPSKKANKIAINSSLDLEANEIVSLIIKGDSSKTKKELPVEGNIIKPLYLFLDQEILLYSKLKGLKFEQSEKNKDKVENFLDEFEKKHPEVKRAVVNSLLELYASN